MEKTESWRFPVAIALCALILFGWVWLSNKLWPPPPPRPPAPPVPAAAPPGVPPPVAVAPTTAPPTEKPVEHPAKDDVVLDSKFLRATLTNRGAGVKALTLKYPEGKGEVELLAPRAAAPPHLAVRIQGGPDPVETLHWEQSASSADSVEYRYRMRNGVEITKRFRILPDQHKLTFTLGLANRNAPPPDAKEPAPIPQTLELLAFHGLEHDSDYRSEQYFAGVALNEGKVKPRLLPDLEKADVALQAARAKQPNDPAAVEAAEKGVRLGGPHKTWFGLKSRFFTVLVAPDEQARISLESYAWSPLPARGDARRYAGLKNLAASGRTDPLKVGAAPVLLGFELFAGPVKRDVLKELPGGEKVLDYGGCFPFSALVDVVAPVILGLLKFFGGMLRNYGVAIILTTLLIRMVLFPLSKKSQESAFRMQELGPKIQALRERYKDDQQKFGMEQMRLFREHKINPFSGCLPLLFQLPIFIGMYSVFEMSVELRNAPFFLWIRDLSEPDRLLGPWAPVNIPLIITTLSIDSLNLLPILMTIVWFLQAYFAPRSPDPQMAAQQKMMMFMPVFFGLMCYSLAAGLSLYFLVNSALSMAEQKLIKKFFLKPRTDAAGGGT